MSSRIIDCCSLINLYAGWAGLDNLRVLPHTWFICTAVEGESEKTREYDDNHVPQEQPMLLQPFVDSGLLHSVGPDSEAEQADFLVFAQELEDGEAQALALAKHRGFVLLTDDKKARKIAERDDVGVATVSTVDVLREWIVLAEIERPDVRNVLGRIRELAHFMPPKNTADLEWWLAQLTE